MGRVRGREARGSSAVRGASAGRRAGHPGGGGAQGAGPAEPPPETPHRPCRRRPMTRRRQRGERPRLAGSVAVSVMSQVPTRTGAVVLGSQTVAADSAWQPWLHPLDLRRQPIGRWPPPSAVSLALPRLRAKRCLKSTASTVNLSRQPRRLRCSSGSKVTTGWRGMTGCRARRDCRVRLRRDCPELALAAGLGACGDWDFRRTLLGGLPAGGGAAPTTDGAVGRVKYSAPPRGGRMERLRAGEMSARRGARRGGGGCYVAKARTWGQSGDEPMC